MLTQLSLRVGQAGKFRRFLPQLLTEGRTDSGVSPVHSRDARKNEPGPTDPIQIRASLTGVKVLLRRE
jgi:hypothetical protein